MLSEKDKQFIIYWEKNRDRESQIYVKLLQGLPMAFLFSLPILLSVMVVRLYFPDWYTKIAATSPGMFLTVIIAVFIVVIFYAFFRMHFRWEENEELYQKLKQQQIREKNL